MKRAKKESKAEPRFFSIEDITEFFDKNPAALYAYVQTGLSKRAAVMGVHFAQLAKMAGIPLLFDGQTYDTLPKWSWVEPNKFKNVNLLLHRAETMFPSR